MHGTRGKLLCEARDHTGIENGKHKRANQLNERQQCGK